MTRSWINPLILIILFVVKCPESAAGSEPKLSRARLDAFLTLVPHQTRMDPSVRVDLEELRKGLRSKDEKTRFHAAERLCQLGPKAEPVVRSLLEAYFVEPIPYIFEQMRRAIVSVGKRAASPTAEVLRDKRRESNPRGLALLLLEDLPFDSTITGPAIRKAVTDQDKWIAFQAALFLVKRNPRDADGLAVLVRAVKKPPYQDAELRAAVALIPTPRKKEALPVLLRYTEDSVSKRMFQKFSEGILIHICGRRRYALPLV